MSLLGAVVGVRLRQLLADDQLADVDPVTEQVGDHLLRVVDRAVRVPEGGGGGGGGGEEGTVGSGFWGQYGLGWQVLYTTMVRVGPSSDYRGQTNIARFFDPTVELRQVRILTVGTILSI